MQELKVRKIDFKFGDDIPFQFNPSNLYWSNFVNYTSLIGPAFERYFIRAIREAMPRIRDPRVAHDADLFCQQEAQHSRQHLAHVAVLTRRYPGLEETRKALLDSYERLFQEESLEFHLSYAATVELAFGPTARFVIDGRDALFKGGDSRISSFMLWHFLEEFEHRNAAIDVYNDVVGSYLYRMRMVPKVIRHLREVFEIAQAGLLGHVPAGDLPVPADVTGLRMFDGIGAMRKLSYVYELACTFLPYHRPDNIRQPEWAARWFADEAAGCDMAQYYS